MTKGLFLSKLPAMGVCGCACAYLSRVGSAEDARGPALACQAEPSGSGPERRVGRTGGYRQGWFRLIVLLSAALLPVKSAKRTKQGFFQTFRGVFPNKHMQIDKREDALELSTPGITYLRLEIDVVR